MFAPVHTNIHLGSHCPVGHCQIHTGKLPSTLLQPSAVSSPWVSQARNASLYGLHERPLVYSLPCPDKGILIYLTILTQKLLTTTERVCQHPLCLFKIWYHTQGQNAMVFCLLFSNHFLRISKHPVGNRGLHSALCINLQRPIYYKLWSASTVLTVTAESIITYDLFLLMGAT